MSRLFRSVVFVALLGAFISHCEKEKKKDTTNENDSMKYVNSLSVGCGESKAPCFGTEAE